MLLRTEKPVVFRGEVRHGLSLDDQVAHLQLVRTQRNEHFDRETNFSKCVVS